MVLEEGPRKNALKEVFTCGICRELLYKANTLICQHTFCQSCLMRTKDRKCPICKLAYVIPKEYSRVVDEAEQILFNEEYADRSAELAAESQRLSIEEKLRREIYNEVVNSTLAEIDTQRLNQDANRSHNTISSHIELQFFKHLEKQTSILGGIINTYKIAAVFFGLTGLIMFLNIVNAMSMNNAVFSAVFNSVALLYAFSMCTIYRYLQKSLINFTPAMENIIRDHHAVFSGAGGIIHITQGPNM